MTRAAVHTQPIPAPRYRRKAIASDAALGGTAVAIFFGAHAMLGLAMFHQPAVAGLHAFGTAIFGLWLAATTRRLEQVAYVGAYITGCEVLWRMTDAGFFWEGGKYAIAAIFVVAMLRNRMAPPALPTVFLALLVPSVLLTLLSEDPSLARGMLSSTLSGPLAFVAAACFFSHIRLTPMWLQRLLVTLMGPALGVAAITLEATLTSEALVFVTESNEVTSGGFGPNQVSSALGLGALFGFLCLVLTRGGPALRVLVAGATLLLAAQSAMTFSRGGLWNAAVAIAVATPFLLASRGYRSRLVLVGGTLFLAITVFVLPKLVDLTGGMIITRFSDTDTTRRTELVEADLAMWYDNPILGVGPGRSKPLHADYTNKGYSTHTEFSRLAAEHGIFGIGAGLLLLVMAGRNILRARVAGGRALSAAAAGWGFLYMLSAAMRLAAPSFMLGLSFVTLEPEESARRTPTPSGRQVRRVVGQRPKRRVQIGSQAG